MTWEEKQGEIAIRHEGSATGCAVVPFTIIGLGIIALGILMYLEIVVLPFDGNHLPLMAFTALFGFFLCYAALNSSQGSAESTVIIDTFNKIIRYKGHKEDSEVIIPFSHLQALIVHETVTEKSTYRNVGVRGPETSFPAKTYTYRLYFHRTDGSIFWL
ncbi:MAG: hypothetical protein HN368_00135, partial [Spirochaetales bacterium]|nr:hypothetical protein [Spirochaetales bacterium]